MSSKAKRGFAATATKVKRNERGGVLVTTEDLMLLSSFLDPLNSGMINKKSLECLSILFPTMTSKDFNLLLNEKEEVPFEEIKQLLRENELNTYDPTIDAFKALDPLDTGIISREVIKELFRQFNYGEPSEDQLNFLIYRVDQDNDGAIGIQDFRALTDLVDVNELLKPEKNSTNQGTQIRINTSSKGSSKKSNLNQSKTLTGSQKSSKTATQSQTPQFRQQQPSKSTVHTQLPSRLQNPSKTSMHTKSQEQSGS